ncbi:winged helix DNA-binding domain-containing protein [Amycolatopsis cihanbeyliensis]|uniref:Winged helix DNA-binding protein n=1 Tax=Amycolatopsis cihanbeyliensis TaxID=1128664 RepID=A0A542CSS5_AMYCI|nr:winged helix DNA-binding domain-containing protein [Amycolatopsis cihanbeyliensis]TQI93881.1 winged helix DNA-binding protein [Amycolatopsis cihanbeyliensis]
MTRRMDVQQRRARLGARHLLAGGGTAGRPEAVAEAMVALHATDPATVHLAVAARSAEPDIARTERALYEERTLLRMLGMRRTMFVVPTGVAPVVQAGCTADIARKQRKLLVRHLGEQGYPENVPEPEAWLAEVSDATERALLARGAATAQQLAEDEPRLRQRLLMSPGKPYAATPNVTSRVLFQLAAEGRIVRGRPRGSWLSSQYEWSPMAAWLPGGLAEPDEHQARVELARRWLYAYGPARIGDLRWWTGWTAGQTGKALAEIGPAEVDLDGTPGLVLPDDLEPVATPAPWVALLPELDPTPMGWSERGWFLGEYGPRLFDRNGNIGPTVWSDGRIVGGWTQRPDGEVGYRLLEDIGGEAEAAVEAKADRLREWFGEVRLVPRFRTPLERELAS